VTPGEAVGTLDDADPYSDDFAAQAYQSSYSSAGGVR